MLKLPICGFAKRVDDTVSRAMAILRTREDYTVRREQSVFSPRPSPITYPVGYLKSARRPNVRSE